MKSTEAPPTSDAPGATTQTWVLQPVQSLNWAQTKAIILAVASVEAGIGVFFYVLGLPLVLPFCGVEALAVGIAFYVVFRAGSRREVIRLGDDLLTIERGRERAEERYEFNRFWVRVELQPPAYRNHRRRLLVGLGGRYQEIGAFLPEGERESFARLLINALKKNR